MGGGTLSKIILLGLCEISRSTQKTHVWQPAPLMGVGMRTNALIFLLEIYEIMRS